MNPHIVVVGSLNADFVLGVERFPAPGETIAGRDFAVIPGGKGANQAYAAARLGARVSMIGQVGGDGYAELLKGNLAGVGVDVSHVRVDENVSSGVAVISVDAAGQNHIIIVAGANGTFGVERLDESARELIARAYVVLLQLEIPLPMIEAAARIAKAGGAIVILDPAPAREFPDSLLALSDYLTPNETELAALTHSSLDESSFDARDIEAKARQLISRGANKVIVKMGSRGALLVTKEGTQMWPAFRVAAVDTTAAGDAFNAAFTVALAEGKSEIEAGEFATAAAAYSVTKHGAQPSMPTRADTRKYMKVKGKRGKRGNG
ncbi:MAG: ribokinase [Acidobacteriota bacterium]|nr:ribokinase [Acidobacteriota bacterium]